MSLDDELRAEQQQRLAGGLERSLEGPRPELVDFASNDYLGLARDPELIGAARAALEEFGSGGRAARLLGGGSLERELERQAAHWLAVEATLLFPSGYQANLGLVTSLAGRGDALFCDALNHASLIDAARLSRAGIQVYAHADPAALEHQLRSPAARAARRRIVLTESVFSMDGDLAPLAELARLCEQHDAWLVVDEAHAVGLLGPERQGAAAELESPRLAARVITGGKALGTSGALVAGSRALVDQLVNRARSFVYTTASVPAAVAAFAAAIEVVRSSGERSRKALAAARRLASALELPPPSAAIVPVVIGPEHAALEAARALRDELGFDVRAVRPPTVPAGTSRLRVSCHADHEPRSIDRLTAAIAALLPVREAEPAELAPRAVPRVVPLVVAGTDTDIGKTVVSALLVRAAARRGPAAYWKAVQTGTDSDTRTVAALAGIDPRSLAAPAYEFPLPASPHEAAAAAGARIDPARIDSQAIERAAGGKPLVLELAGGLLVPWSDDITQLDWLTHTPHELVLVARSGLGTLNHTLLSLEALRARQLEPRALFLVGPAHSSNRATLARLGGISTLFELPHFEPLTTQALDAWIDEHDLSAALPAPRR